MKLSHCLVSMLLRLVFIFYRLGELRVLGRKLALVVFDNLPFLIERRVLLFEQHALLCFFSDEAACARRLRKIVPLSVTIDLQTHPRRRRP